MEKVILCLVMALNVIAVAGQTIFPTQHTAPAEYNTGTVHVSVLSKSEHQMTTSFLFEPGSRNSWHYHPHATQVLMVIRGEGYYQEQGKAKRLIGKGDVIVTAPNVRHWNGATPGSEIECLTVTDIVAAEEHVVQLAKVSDEEYNATTGADGMIVRLAEIEVVPEFLEQYMQEAQAIERSSLESEPGVLCLFPCQIKGESDKIRILEIYRSQGAYQSHIESEHFLRYKQTTKHMVKSLKLIDITPLDMDNMTKIFRRK